MEALHSMKPEAIVHRDLKADNVLLDRMPGPGVQATAKIADFGVAKMWETVASTMGTLQGGAAGGGGMTGTMAFKAPETFDGRYTEASDVFSMGVTAFEVVSRQRPFAGKSNTEVFGLASERFKLNERRLKRDPVGESKEMQRNLWIEDNPLRMRRPDLDLTEDGCPPDLLSLIRKCWADDPSMRPTFSDCTVDLQQILDGFTLASTPHRKMSLPLQSTNAYALWRHTEGSPLHLTARSCLVNTWIKRHKHEPITAGIEVHEIVHEKLEARYEEYKSQLALQNEQLLFHACKEESMHNIIEKGFLKEFWQSTTGQWQRFGPGKLSHFP
eukprot:COSAG06_NODE_9949_length_1784_cov_1.638576_2_plen_328_part_00